MQEVFEVPEASQTKITRLLDVLIVRKITIHSFAQKRGVNRDCIKPRMKRKILEMKMLKTIMKIRISLIQIWYNFILVMIALDMMMEMILKK